MLNRNKILLSTAGVFAAIVPLATLTSCRETEDEKQAKKVVALKKQFEEEFQKTFPIPFPSREENERIINFIQGYINEISKIKTDNLSTDVVAWINGLKYNWEIQQGNYKNGLRYLFATFSDGPSDTYVANSFFTNDLKYMLTDRPEDVQKEIAKRWYETAKEAVEKNLVPSKIFIKSNINSALKSTYSERLKEFLAGTETEKTVKSLINFNTAKAEKDYTVQDWIDKFYDYYVTTYYKASTYGKGENIDELKISKDPITSLDEKENIISVKNNKDEFQNVYGLGFTKKDLEQKNIGIGYIPGKPGEITGKEIYKQILKMCTTSELTPEQVFQKGVASTKSAADNMRNIANAVADLIAGKDADWSPTFKYDSDGIETSEEAKDVTLEVRKNKQIDLTNFNKWLNAEDFFFGREDKSYYSNDLKKELETDPNLASAREWLQKLDYESELKGKNDPYGSITKDQFYYGALEAFKGYEQFKATTMDYGRSFFSHKVPDYDIKTYKYSEREEVGVGEENPSEKRFSFNADPYYSLPKWSVTSFANHESVMGHHNQFMYADHFLAKIGKSKTSLDPRTFNYTSYIEGWALFMEWFGIEAGYYGTPDYENENYYAMPKDFSFAKGITSFATKDNIKDKNIIEQIKKLHGGVYWNKVVEKGLNKATEEEQARAAIKLANMLQYFGALNEAQLRNMRLSVDTIYHGSDVTGTTDLPKGASIMDARKYMTNNSALGIGDITSESKRYFNAAGQATSYNSGKEVFLDLYKKIHNKLGLTREQFVNATNKEFGEHGEIKKLFDWILRNSALPMGAIEEIMKRVYKI